MNNVGRIKTQVKSCHPAYFALVMATGIISIGCQQLHLNVIADTLFVLNNVQYIILLFVFIVRIILYFPEVKKDLATHAKGAGFLTFVAGSSIVGTGYVEGKQMFLFGIILLILAFIAYLIILYSFLASVILQQQKPSLESGLNGSWLLLVVSTQSLVILATSLVQHQSIPVNFILFPTLSAWLAGIILYVIFVTIIMYRLTFYPVNASEVSPSYWIDTGAAAITTVAGATLSSALAGINDLKEYIPVINLLSLLLWAVATFWLPLLFILETWRHFKIGYKYSPDYWSIVFPLGMYTVATLKIESTFRITFLNTITYVFIFVALTAWMVVFTGMVIKLGRSLFSNKSVETTNI